MSDQETAQSQPPDGELVTGLLHGRSEAFTVLYRHYQPRLVRWLQQRTADRAAAEDLAHDTLTRALESLDDFDPARPLWPWLRTIAANLATDQHRTAITQLPTVSHDDAIRDAQLATVDDDADLLAERELLTQALHALPDRQRVAVSLRYLHDWAPADIGRLLDLTRVSTEQLLLRARRRLSNEYRRLTRDGLHGWAWPLLWPYHALRDRLARLRDTLTNTAPGPTLASAEALTATAAITALAIMAATISLGGAMNPGSSTTLATEPSPVASQFVAWAGNLGTGPVSARPLTPSTPALSTTATSLHDARPGTTEGTVGAVTIRPQTPATAQDPAMHVRVRIERDDDQARIIVDERQRHPLGGGEDGVGRGYLELPCDGTVNEATCDTVEGVPDLASPTDVSG